MNEQYVGGRWDQLSHEVVGLKIKLHDIHSLNYYIDDLVYFLQEQILKQNQYDLCSVDFLGGIN